MKILSTIISYFVTIYALFGRLGAEKCFFGTTLVFLGQEVDHYMVFIAYHTEFANTRKNEALVGKIANMRLTKIFVGIFAPRQKAANFCPPGGGDYFFQILLYFIFPDLSDGKR